MITDKECETHRRYDQQSNQMTPIAIEEVSLSPAVIEESNAPDVIKNIEMVRKQSDAQPRGLAMLGKKFRDILTVINTFYQVLTLLPLTTTSYQLLMFLSAFNLCTS